MTALTRCCNGGPNARAWCGEPALYVAHDEEGLGWFCCPAHAEGCGARPETTLDELDPWLEKVRREAEELYLACEAVRVLASWKYY